MPLHPASYFAGVGTVIATVALGFGAGIVMTDAFVGKSENPPTLAERRAATPSESTPTVAAVQSPPAAVEAPAAPASAPQPPVAAAQGAASTAAPQVTASSSETPSPPQTRAAQNSVAQPAAAPAQPSAPPIAQGPAPYDQAMARAREDDIRKALAAERRKEDRRKWAERRKRELKRIEELNEVAEKVKDAERERGPVFRSFFAQSPAIRLEDD